MSATYRCCCNEDCSDVRCGQLWCECPEYVYVTTCTRTSTVELFTCDSEGWDECSLPNGTSVGLMTCTRKLSNVKFRRVQCGTSPNQSCGYEIVTGAEQTGLIEVSVDAEWKACADSRYNDETEECECAWYNSTCIGTATAPLSGANGWVTNLYGRLRTGGCPGGFLPITSCENECYCKAGLWIEVEGSKPQAGTYTSCATPCGDAATTLIDLGLATTFQASWECRHHTRWEGECPNDLNQYDPSCTWGNIPGVDMYCAGCSQFPGSQGPCPPGPNCGQFGYSICNWQGIDSCAPVTILATCSVTTVSENCPSGRCVTISS